MTGNLRRNWFGYLLVFAFCMNVAVLVRVVLA